MMLLFNPISSRTAVMSRSTAPLFLPGLRLRGIREAFGVRRPSAAFDPVTCGRVCRLPGDVTGYGGSATVLAICSQSKAVLFVPHKRRFAPGWGRRVSLLDGQLPIHTTLRVVAHRTIDPVLSRR
jgi:hypothetical protein